MSSDACLFSPGSVAHAAAITRRRGTRRVAVSYEPEPELDQEQSAANTATAVGLSSSKRALGDTGAIKERRNDAVVRAPFGELSNTR